MVYTILISIVFIAELIIAATLIQYLLKFDRLIIDANTQVSKFNPQIKEVGVLVKKISNQVVILTQDFVDDYRRNAEEVAIKQGIKMLLGILLMKINIRFINRIRKSKVTKTIVKGLTFIGNMV